MNKWRPALYCWIQDTMDRMPHPGGARGIRVADEIEAQKYAPETKTSDARHVGYR